MKNKIKYIVFGIIFASLMSVTVYASTSDAIMNQYYLQLYGSIYPKFNSPYTVEEGEGVVNEVSGALTTNTEDYHVEGKNEFDVSVVRSFNSQATAGKLYEEELNNKADQAYYYYMYFVCSADGQSIIIRFNNEQEMYDADPSFEGAMYGDADKEYWYEDIKKDGTGIYYTLRNGEEPRLYEKEMGYRITENSIECSDAFVTFDSGMKISKPSLVWYNDYNDGYDRDVYLLFQDLNAETYAINIQYDTEGSPDKFKYSSVADGATYTKYKFSCVDNNDMSVTAVHPKGFEYNRLLKSDDGYTYYVYQKNLNGRGYDVLGAEDPYGNTYVINTLSDGYSITTDDEVVYEITTEGVLKKYNDEITQYVSYDEVKNNSAKDINQKYKIDDEYIFTVKKNSGTGTEISDTEENTTKYYVMQKLAYERLLRFGRYSAYELPYKIELPSGITKHIEYNSLSWLVNEPTSEAGTISGLHYPVGRLYDEDKNGNIKNERTYSQKDSEYDRAHSFISQMTCSELADGSVVKTTISDIDWHGKINSQTIKKDSKTYDTYTYGYISSNSDAKLTSVKETNTFTGSGTPSYTKSYSYLYKYYLAEETNGDYTVNYTYHTDGNYLPKETTYQKDANTTVKTENLLTDDKKSIATTNVYENDVLVKTTSYTYDTYGNVASETVRIDDDNSMITTYVYDYGPDGSYTLTTTVKGIKDADGNALPDIVTVNVYDADYNLIAQIDPNGNPTIMTYDYLGRLLTTQYPDGTSESYTYDISEGITTYTAQDGTVYKAYFDAWGNRLKTTAIVNGEEVQFDEYEYDDRCNVVSYKRFTDDDSYIKAAYTYDYLSRPLTEKVYDNDSTLLKTTTYSYTITKDANSKPLDTITATVTGDNGTYAKYSETTNYRGFLTESKSFTADDERVNTFTYDYVGNVITATDAAGNVTTTSYDALNNPVSVTYADGSTVSTTYNGLGLTSTQTDAMGNTAEYVYDNAGRLIKLYTPFDKDNKGLTKTYYDSNGNVISTKVLSSLADDAENYTVTDNTYNNMNRLVSNAVYPTDSSAIYTRYEYNTMGNPTKVVSGLNSPEAPESTGHVVTYEYDTLGRMIKTTTPDGISETAEYDLQGRVIKSTDKANRDTLFTYDAFNNVLSKQTGTEAVNYTYNILGLRTSMTDSTGTTNYAYSPYGELTMETKGDIIKSYEYDVVSNPTVFNVTNADESLISQSYTYDAIGRLMSVSNGTDTVAYTYDANSNMLTSAHNGDVYREVQYNNANLPVFTQLNNGENTADITRYIYSPGGNLAMSMGTDVSSMYYYDGAGRLVYENTWGDELGYDDTFTYDSFGNRVSRAHRDYYGNTSENTEYTYNSINQLIEQSNGTNTTAYTYDAAGNMTTVTKDGATVKNYTYDNFNRLSSATVDGVTSAYTYNGDNLRQSKTVNGVTTNHIYDGANIVADLGTDTTVFVRGNGLALLKNASATQVYGITPRGDVAKIISPDGTMTGYTYTAFGETTGDNNNVLNPFGYTGEYTDTETGLIYLRNRYYDPEIGMFITEDPAKDGLNWYVYCGGNPVMFVDPWGLDAYIIYDPSEDFMTDQAKDEYKKLKKKYDSIHIISAKDKDKFIKAWNNMGINDKGKSVEIEEVIIIAHGSPTSLAFGNDSISTYGLSTLDEKEMGKLNVSSCNTGHLDVDNNVATTFLNNNSIDEVIAWDGTASYYKFLWWSGRDGLALDQKSFYNYASTESRPIYALGSYMGSYEVSRSPMGEIHYSKNANGVIVQKNKSGEVIVSKKGGGFTTK